MDLVNIVAQCVIVGSAAMGMSFALGGVTYVLGWYIAHTRTLLLKAYHITVVNYWLGRLETHGVRVFRQAEAGDLETRKLNRGVKVKYLGRVHHLSATETRLSLVHNDRGWQLYKQIARERPTLLVAGAESSNALEIWIDSIKIL